MHILSKAKIPPLSCKEYPNSSHDFGEKKYMLSPSDADSQAVFWGKGEDNTVQSHPVITSRSQGFPHPTSCGQWPCGSDFQEIRKKRERGIAFSEPGSVSSYAFSNSLITHDIEGFKVGHWGLNLGPLPSLPLSLTVHPPVTMARLFFGPLMKWLSCQDNLVLTLYAYTFVRIHAPTTHQVAHFGCLSLLGPGHPSHAWHPCLVSVMSMMGPPHLTLGSFNSPPLLLLPPLTVPKSLLL